MFRKTRNILKYTEDTNALVTYEINLRAYKGNLILKIIFKTGHDLYHLHRQIKTSSFTIILFADLMLFADKTQTILNDNKHYYQRRLGIRVYVHQSLHPACSQLVLV